MFLALKKNEKGFILLELVAVLAVVGFLLVPVLSMLAGAVLSVSRSGQETRAVYLAQERMEELKGLGYYFLRERIMGGEASAVLNEGLGPFERVVALKLMEVNIADVISLEAGLPATFGPDPLAEGAVSPAGIILIQISVKWQEGEHFVSISSYLGQG